jgi:hypothetical protein
LGNVLHESGRDGDDAPGHEDPGDPASCADFLHQEVAGNLKDEVPEGEQTGDQAELSWRDSEIIIHLQRREADVRAVDEGDDVEQTEERDDAPFDLLDDVRPVREFSRCGDCGHDTPIMGREAS